MRHILFVSLALLCMTGVAQAPCDRLTAFDSVRTYFETNHPGLNTWRHTPDWAPYEQAANALRAEMQQLRSPDVHGVYVQRYVHLLKDHHSWISPPPPEQPHVDDADSASVEAFLHSPAYLSTERVVVDTAALFPQLRALPVDAVNGIYRDQSGTYEVAVMPSEDPAYDHVGVIIASTSPYWSPGMVKLKLKHLDADRYAITLWMRYHVPLHSILTVHGGIISDLGYRKWNMPPPGAMYAFKALDDSTNYMQVASFDGSLYAELDSFYRANEAALLAKRNLIIDLRGNGGGSEGCWEALIPYIYTDPLTLVQADLLAAPGNIARYTEQAAAARADSAHGDPHWAAALDAQIKKMRAVAPGSFVRWDDGPPGRISMHPDTVPQRPARVYILQDGGCASATESFIYYATRNTTRVTTVGTNTGGFMAYGNVSETRICGYTLGCTTTRYNAFRNYEFLGLPPQVPIGPGEDALQIALRIIREKR